MNAVVSPVPVVLWRPSAPRPRTSRVVRVLGALVGAGASWVLAFALQALAYPATADGSVFEVSPFLGLGAAIALLGAALPVPAAVAGALWAPIAWRARDLGEWLGVAAGLALITVLTGAVAAASLTIPAALSAPDPLAALAMALVAGLFVIAIGIPFVGPFVLPFTAIGAVLWCLGMWLIRDVARGLRIEAASS